MGITKPLKIQQQLWRNFFQILHLERVEAHTLVHLSWQRQTGTKRPYLEKSRPLLNSCSRDSLPHKHVHVLAHRAVCIPRYPRGVLFKELVQHACEEVPGNRLFRLAAGTATAIGRRRGLRGGSTSWRRSCGVVHVLVVVFGRVEGVAGLVARFARVIGPAGATLGSATSSTACLLWRHRQLA